MHYPDYDLLAYPKADIMNAQDTSLIAMNDVWPE